MNANTPDEKPGPSPEPISLEPFEPRVAPIYKVLLVFTAIVAATLLYGGIQFANYDLAARRLSLEETRIHEEQQTLRQKNNELASATAATTSATSVDVTARLVLLEDAVMRAPQSSGKSNTVSAGWFSATVDLFFGSQSATAKSLKDEFIKLGADVTRESVKALSDRYIRMESAEPKAPAVGGGTASGTQVNVFCGNRPAQPTGGKPIAPQCPAAATTVAK